MDEPTGIETQARVPAQQVQWVDAPHDFKVPWKNNDLFIVDGMAWQVYEMKRAKPYPRALVRLVKIAIAVPLDAPVSESVVPVSESPTARKEFENEQYSPKPPQ